MKLRTQLLVINVLSVALLVAAVVLSYRLMLLNLKQAQLLTLIAVGAGVISAFAYWLMTIPMTRSVKNLAQFAEHVGAGNFDATPSQVSTATQRLTKQSHGTLNATSVSVSGPQEIRQLAQSIEDMKVNLQHTFHRLESMERTRRELVANVSHDLRTPIAAVQSFVEALDDQVIEDRETRQFYLKTIQREVQKLSSMIDDLFELSRLEAGQQEFNPLPSRLDQVILEVLESYALRIQEKGLRVKVDVSDEIPVISMMPDKVSRVLSNLLENGIRHSPQGSELKIVARELPGQQVVEVSLQDSGQGISDEEAERVFERFFRTDAARHRDSGGAGLGLAIARSLVELHGGQIGVRVPPERTSASSESGSSEASGSVFWFTLPLRPA